LRWSLRCCGNLCEISDGEETVKENAEVLGPVHGG
jgi:hypothetical protein